MRFLNDVATEIERQDLLHPPGYPATQDGVFLGLTTARHEIEDEGIEAWRMDRCRCPQPVCGHATWERTRVELVQAAAVLLRTVRSIDEAALDRCNVDPPAGLR